MTRRKYVGLILALSLILSSCVGHLPPQIGPAGTIAAYGEQVGAAGRAAVKVIGALALTSPPVIRPEVADRALAALEKLGAAGVELAGTLTILSQVRDCPARQQAITVARSAIARAQRHLLEASVPDQPEVVTALVAVDWVLFELAMQFGKLEGGRGC